MSFVAVRVDLNCDMGESYGIWKLGRDEEVMPFVTSANIACGFHASDPHVMRRTVQLAKKHGVAVGAHTGFPDREGFGRRYIQVTKDELKDDVIYQVGALAGFLKANGMKLQHVKPHGAMYTVAVNDPYRGGSIVQRIGSPAAGVHSIQVEINRALDELIERRVADERRSPGAD